MALLQPGNSQGFEKLSASPIKYPRWLCGDSSPNKTTIGVASARQAMLSGLAGELMSRTTSMDGSSDPEVRSELISAMKVLISVSCNFKYPSPVG